MKLRMHTDKRGSAIVEAAISMPVFMIAVIVMSSVVLLYSCIEDAGFIAANELRRTAIAARYSSDPLLPQRVGRKLSEAHTQVSGYRLRQYAYRVSQSGMDELILLELELSLRSQNPLGLASEATYDLALGTRAYVGRERKLRPMTAEELSSEGDDPVIVFPKQGERYHGKGCTYVNVRAESAALTSRLQYRYDPCRICDSEDAKRGTLVYYFPFEGEAYHLSGCRALKRNTVEMEKHVAVERGYSACSKCGGQ